MLIVGCDYHPGFQQIAFVDTETGEFEERRLQHRWPRHRMVQTSTVILNQLPAVGLNEGLRCKKGVWGKKGRQQLEGLRLAPWATRRRRDLLELLDRLYPVIAELTHEIEQEVE